MSIPLKPGELPAELQRRLNKLPGMIKRSAKRAAQLGRGHLTRATPVDTGQMKNAWKVVESGDDVLIVNDAPHAGIIEEGARPHKVNAAGIEALTEWAKRQIGASDEEAKSIAYAVAQKLELHGQEGKFIARDALPRLKRIFAQDIVKRIKRQAKRRPGVRN